MTKSSAPRKPSTLEKLFDFQIQISGIPEPEKELTFCNGRKWRFDFAWPVVKLALEIEGGVFSGGRHTRGKGFSEDCEKYSTAAILGWRIIKATGEQVRSGQAISWAEAALSLGRNEINFDDPNP